ncbi:disease resistance protein RGA1 [Populus alba x Populus x berolinensis]|nr:disease resistance protein RGA1 [Populus alba x Populus x berolinensis]
MADAILSALASTIMGNLNSPILQELGFAGGLTTELENLKRTFRTIQAVLQDADEKQWKSEPIKVWLSDLKDAAYAVDDVLDEFAIEARWLLQRRDLKNRVRSFFSFGHNPLVFRQRMAHKLKIAREKLDAIAKERQNFHLTEGAVEMQADSFVQRQTWSSVNESEICGRGKEKEELVSILLDNADNLPIYAIWGMGGLGKTTLVQLVYNEERVKQQFGLRIWVCVSTDFNLGRLTRAIIESIDGASCDLQELDPLQQRLQQKLTGKKFLLVLDDVWDDCTDWWSELKEVLRCGAEGSAVIVTTRLEMVARKMATGFVQHMGRLSGEDSWHFFQQLAFGMRRTEERAHLEAIGVSIVKKCGGVPLAIKALGNLMRLKDNEDQWIAVKESEIWDLREEASKILPALRLSYTNLSPHLKQCFAYCAIFPKDHVMRREELVALWMANGFISCRREMDLHVMGIEIFNELVGRSFLQEVEDDGFGNITCKMHDLMHDLAQSIAGQECYMSTKGDGKLEIPKTARQVAFYNKSVASSSEVLKVLSLRSLLLRRLIIWGCEKLESLPEEGLRNLNSLEVLEIEFCGRLNCLPMNGLCGLSSLRRLFILRCDKLTSLSEGVRHLTALEYLLLSECPELNSLPEGIQHLTSLQSLRIQFCEGLASLPNQIGYLTSLSSLEIVYCPNLESLPDGVRSLSNLSSLKIYKCPKLKKRCKKERGEDWPKIAHIPHIVIS